MNSDSTSRSILVAGLAFAALGLSGCSSADSEPAPTASLVAEYTIEPTLALTREEAVSKCQAAIRDQYAEPIPGGDPDTTSYDVIFGDLEPQVSQEGRDWVVSYTGVEAFSLECNTQGDQVKVTLPGYR